MRESNKHLAAWVDEMYYHLKCKGYADQTAAACMKESAEMMIDYIVFNDVDRIEKEGENNE